MPDPVASSSASTQGGEYVVVARRYRPQAFVQLLGQEHVAQALSGAIETHRVGHAYLFTGARGVGKTSAARIFAKALNCVHGPTPEPCNACDSCQSITAGGDIDVLEIDGASNRGIDEMRDLRQNVSVRPSRSRFKIYIIDEVHMLTEPAFNALLKTLEEPPEHVKFIFCTTEPEKIPITVLSRCQRFDFAGIQTKSIAERLAQIASAEGVEAERTALEALARRAAGSMRDSQSLLEQLLSFGGARITLTDVERMLGTAGDRRLSQLAQALAIGDGALSLTLLDQALAEGVDVGPLLDQLLGYFRDCLVSALGAPSELFRYSSPSEETQLTQLASVLGVETTLAIMQILEQTIARMRLSTQGRILAELAFVRVCKLDDLEQLSNLIAQLKTPGEPSGSRATRMGVAPSSPSSPSPRGAQLAALMGVPSAAPRAIEAKDSPAEKKKPEIAATPPDPRPAVASFLEPLGNSNGHSSAGPVPEVAPAEASPVAQPPSESENEPEPALQPAVHQSAAHEPLVLSRSTLVQSGVSTAVPPATASEPAAEIWRKALAMIDDMFRDWAEKFTGAAILAPNTLAVYFPAGYDIGKSFCERPEQSRKAESALEKVLGRKMRVEFRLEPGEPGAESGVKPKPKPSPRERMIEKSKTPFVAKAMELFDARVTRVDETT